MATHYSATPVRASRTQSLTAHNAGPRPPRPRGGLGLCRALLHVVGCCGGAPILFRRGVLVLAFIILALARNLPAADSSSSGSETPAARADRLFHEARQRCQKETNNLEAAWQFARACFDLAEYATTDGQRADLAERGIGLCRQAIARDPRLGAAHYYLALNLGQLARTKSLGALKLVNEMETEFKRAIDLHGAFDYAGPHRSLGLLYRDAPGWPTSLGSRSKARAHLLKAVELSSDYPDNQISLLESQLEWGEKRAVATALPTAEQVLIVARKKLTGAEWAASWQDWDNRWHKLKTKATGTFKPIETPRTKK